MEVDLKFRSIWLLPIIALLGVFIGNLLASNQRDTRDQYYANQVDDLDIAFTETTNSYELATQIIFDEVINQPEILELYSGAYQADEAEQAQIRAELLALLQDDYENWQNLSLRQLHFHLPDNSSFLRFHRPDRFGDSLTDVRYSVRMTNAQQIPFVGFEEGRIFNGFRYVYPLFWEDEHIGSVETSVSFNALQQQLNELFPGGITFMLRRDVTLDKVFEDEQDNYLVSDISETYVYDREIVETYTDEEISWELIQDINAQINDEQIQTQLDRGERFAINVELAGKNYVVTFLPVNNVEGKQVAYILSYHEDDFIANSQSNFYVALIAIMLSIIGFGIFLFYRDRSHFALVDQRNQLVQKANELTQANESLNIARREAEAANQLKSQFLANMSHELRTPLNAMIGYSQLQLEGMVGEIPPKAKEFQERILLNAQDLLRLINDLLDISKIEAGRMDLVIKPFDVRSLIVEVTEQNRVLASKKNLEFNTIIDKNLPELIVGDEVRTKQVITNLVSNAIKFTEEGSINLRIEKASQNIWRIVVKDTGKGIPPHLHDVIFDEFRQAEPSAENTLGGTGLGLAITRRLIVMMGGTINLRSEIGKGSEFIVTLPISIEINVKE